MQINGRVIGPNRPPYIIAEISANHCGDIEKCILLMGAAIGAGADAVKLQCYDPNTLTLDCDKTDFIIKEGPWAGCRLYELYQKARTPLEWFPTLFDVAKRYNTTLFSSVFDAKSLALLEELDCPAYKIASMEITDTPLIVDVAKTKKPIIISTGMASDKEVYEAFEAAGRWGYEPGIALLRCISGYPSKVEEANLWQLKDGPVSTVMGISDHTPGHEVPMIATAMGAEIIEKHICINHSDPSEDAGFSLDIEEFRAMCKAVKRTYAAMQPSKAESEESSRQLRRSLYVTEDIKKGEMFTPSNIRSIRPSYGLEPKYKNQIVGKVAQRDIERGTALSWEMVGSS